MWWWLTVQASVKRMLSQLDAIRLYFVLLKSEDMSKENEPVDNVIITLRDPLTLAYLEFSLDYALGLMNDFNTTFQAEGPLIHIHKQKYEKLLATLAINFMEPSHVRECDSTTIDPHDDSNYISLRDVYPGPAAYETIQNLGKSKEMSVKLEYPSPLFNSGLQDVDDDLNFETISYVERETPLVRPQEPASAIAVSQSELGVSQDMRINSFYIHCRDFYITAISDMKSRFDFTDPVYEVVTMLHPENARNLKPRTLSALFERFAV
ncbi:uncharacterized protein LOC116934619 [Daphnia magna]|uniref:uncharacterized protein LOC116934619 n=1 Tax=Daphnia magna TaxID=35525 RepID=UPI001E1BAD45|nr:uncharacterized protein LOC116934619 [Daphnia magna]